MVEVCRLWTRFVDCFHRGWLVLCVCLLREILTTRWDFQASTNKWRSVKLGFASIFVFYSLLCFVPAIWGWITAEIREKKPLELWTILSTISHLAGIYFWFITLNAARITLRRFSPHLSCSETSSSVTFPPDDFLSLHSRPVQKLRHQVRFSAQ